MPEFIQAMRRRGHNASLIHQIVYENPISFLSQSPHFDLVRSDIRTGSGAVSRQEARVEVGV